MNYYHNTKIDYQPFDNGNLQDIKYLTIGGKTITGRYSIYRKTWKPKIRAVINRLLKSQNTANFLKANLI